MWAIDRCNIGRLVYRSPRLIHFVFLEHIALYVDKINMPRTRSTMIRAGSQAQRLHQCATATPTNLGYERNPDESLTPTAARQRNNACADDRDNFTIRAVMKGQTFQLFFTKLFIFIDYKCRLITHRQRRRATRQIKRLTFLLRYC